MVTTTAGAARLTAAGAAFSLDPVSPRAALALPPASPPSMSTPRPPPRPPPPPPCPPPRRARPRLERLEGRTLPDAAANAVFVAQLYRDLLQREADPTGLAAFSAALDSGAANRS